MIPKNIQKQRIICFVQTNAGTKSDAEKFIQLIYCECLILFLSSFSRKKSWKISVKNNMKTSF